MRANNTHTHTHAHTETDVKWKAKKAHAACWPEPEPVGGPWRSGKLRITHDRVLSWLGGRIKSKQKIQSTRTHVSVRSVLDLSRRVVVWVSDEDEISHSKLSLRSTTENRGDLGENRALCLQFPPLASVKSIRQQAASGSSIRSACKRSFSNPFWRG